MIAKITLGTRGSELARAQALLVEKAIRTAHPSVAIETKIIVTRGDNTKVVDLTAGRKGLFTAEIERALLAGEVDVAVHSAKDLPSQTSPGAQITAVLPRAPINDVLISKHSGGLAAVPCGATVATGSVRRQRQLHWKRADLKVVDLRGNVPTRLRKLAENEWDGIYQRVVRESLLSKSALMIKAQKHFSSRQTIPKRCFVCRQSENF